ncbi:MAG: response regulator [Desulfobacterales bacterium]|nr:response regulator [Desulfobacterales bacterium]
MVKIVVVDDEKSSRLSIARMVERMGYVAIQCQNGKIALDILENNPDINLVITDVEMPEMDGRQLIQTMRNNAALSHIPIILISGVVGPRQISDILLLGATAFILKPVQFHDLKEYINRYIESKSL